MPRRYVQWPKHPRAQAPQGQSGSCRGATKGSRCRGRKPWRWNICGSWPSGQLWEQSWGVSPGCPLSVREDTVEPEHKGQCVSIGAVSYWSRCPSSQQARIAMSSVRTPLQSKGSAQPHLLPGQLPAFPFHRHGPGTLPLRARKHSPAHRTLQSTIRSCREVP